MSHRLSHVRNFAIIAHIDHGKSTLADRMIEFTQTVDQRMMQQQLLDDMELEREKGITIKAHPLTMYYRAKNGEEYQLNLIDTPGHVDFSYEVSRSLSACESVLLVVDASQGVQAQTLANVYLAVEKNVDMIPVINKIDLPAADPDAVLKQIEEMIGIDLNHVVLCSAKTGEGIEELLEQIVATTPAPQPSNESSLSALVFDSVYDAYRGVIAYVRLFSGDVQKGSMIQLISSQKTYEVQEVGRFVPHQQACSSLQEGEVGYIIAGIKTIRDVHIGDTITTQQHPIPEPLPGFELIRPVVFAGLYPVDSSDFEVLREAVAKLQLNDSALTVEQESQAALGFGFRCGFLGLLHLEITFERIRREFSLDVFMTSPNVTYHIHLSNGESLSIDNPTHYPDPARIAFIEEPWVQSRLIIPADALGSVMNFALERRGVCQTTESIDARRLLLTYLFPLNEIITDFSDTLKSITKGFGSFDYEQHSYRKSPIVRLEILVNGELVPPFSLLIHRDRARNRGKEISSRLKDIIPRHQFKVPIQAVIGGEVVARETLSALAKNVTAKCYGGDVTRKRKLWEKQKRGKKRMKEFGKVRIPQEAFMQVLKKE